MKIIWTPQAEQDRDDIWEYIASENPVAAARIDGLFSEAAATLLIHPKVGKPGLIQGTRELVPHESYRLVYEIDGNVIWILTLVHTMRQWPPVKSD